MEDQQQWPDQRGVVLDPDLDGVTYVNVFTRGRTGLGRRLTNLSAHGFVHPQFGEFQCVEGFWWYLATSRPTIKSTEHPDGYRYIDSFRRMSGFEARNKGAEVQKSTPVEERFRPDFKTRIKQAIAHKLLAHPVILRELCLSKLPLVHYYTYGQNGNCKVRPANNSLWVIEFLEEVRTTQGKNLDAVVGEQQVTNALKGNANQEATEAI